MESKSSRIGVAIITLLIGLATLIKAFASRECFRSISNFAEANPQGGILNWDLPGHLLSTLILVCLLVSLITIQRGSQKTKKVVIPVVLIIALAAPFAIIYYGDELKNRVTSIIQEQGMQLCQEGVVGRGKYSRQTLEFKPICS